uniref:Lymphocyte specific protein 1 n=1 Tax=Ictidomys tridecemlineatus TaxID=43179 RepID=I3NFU7_ICTTR
MAVASTKSLW